MNSKFILVAMACIAVFGMSNAEEVDNAGMNPENCKLSPELVELRAKCAQELMGKAILTPEEWIKLFQEKEKEAEECFHKHSGEESKETLSEEDADHITKVFTFANDELAQEAVEAVKECIKEVEGKKHESWACILEKLAEICQ